jgi:hypothetical protein
MEREMEEAQKQMSERKAQTERAQRTAAGMERIAEPGKSVRSTKRSFGF